VLEKFFAALMTGAALFASSQATAAGSVPRFDGRTIAPAAIDAAAESLRARARVPGLAVAVVDHGEVVFLNAYGQRDVAGALPLKTDTVMYGASLTKAAFAVMVLQLADEGVINLDRPLADYLPKPLPAYEKYADLANDPRWRKVTARMVLDHTTGFPNFRFFNPDGKLDFKFEPGSRYAYSGEGMNLLQFVLENGLGLEVGAEMKRRVFDRFGMTHTSMTWQPQYADNVTTGYDAAGSAEGHHKRESVRAAGSMDTTIEDYAKFLAAVTLGAGLKSGTYADMMRPQLVITSAHQFPTLDNSNPPQNARWGLAAGLGWVVFRGPYGPAFYKGGHDDYTDNHAVCVARQKRCLLMMTNSGVGARLFAPLTAAVMGDPGTPWSWEFNPPLPLEPAA
jgi:CubicO group peptidase (beta-lactamase class C family)